MSRVTFEDETSQLYHGRQYLKAHRAKKGCAKSNGVTHRKHSRPRKSQDGTEGLAGDVQKYYTHQKYNCSRKEKLSARACNRTDPPSSRKHIKTHKKSDKDQCYRKSQNQRRSETKIEFRNNSKVAKRRTPNSHVEFKAMIQPSSETKNKYFQGDVLNWKSYFKATSHVCVLS